MFKLSATMAKTPTAPTEPAIRKLCGARVFERGQALARARNLRGLTRAGNELFARCAGSYGEPYQLYARLENGAVAQSSCSCPFEGGGWCKHLVALLLRYNHSSADFRETPTLSEMIGALSREDLNLFLENLMRREPQLLASLSQIYAAKPATSGSGPQGLRARLRNALSGRGANEGRVALELAVNDATKARAKKDWAAASEIWRVMLEELVFAAPHFEEVEEQEPEEDDWGYYHEIEVDVGQDWADIAAAGLLETLQQELAPTLRAEILQTLWQCWRDAQDCNYLDVPEEALAPVLDAATPPLWGDVEAYLLERSQNVLYDYKRESTLSSLAQGWNARGQGERATAMLRQHGSYAQRLALSMDEKDYAAAENLALQNVGSHQPNLLAVADDMESAGQLEIAERLALRAREAASPYVVAPILDWLTRFYLRRQDAVAAQAQAAALFVSRPDVAALELWKQTIELDGDWDDWGNRYPRLEKASAMTTPLRVQLAILDGRAARALELFRLLNDREKARVAPDLARVCETELPAKAIELYRELGESQIAARSNSNARTVYQSAAQSWKRARELHKKQGTMDDWIVYIAAQREKYKRLPALLDELKKAGL